MNIFSVVKDNVPLKEAAARYGVEVRRGGRVCCPFHNDRHPSMKLYDDHFYCFACGAHGDVISFVARLLALSNLAAAKRLLYDFHLDPDKPPSVGAVRLPEKTETPRARLRRLEYWKKEYAPQTPVEPVDDRYVEACHKLDYVRWIVEEEENEYAA